MTELSVTPSVIKDSLDIMTLQENGNVGGLKENLFNPIALGFGTIGAYHAYRNNSGIYLSRCENQAARKSLSKLMEIDTAYLNKMCASPNLAISTRAQLLQGQINIAKRAGMTGEMAENLLKEFEILSKQYYKSGLGKVALKAPGLHRAWKSQGGKSMMIFGFAMELMNIIPAFKESTASGLKQTGKSVVKTALNTGGWVAGAAAGAAIGSVLPGAGTVVGGVIGAIASFLGGSLGMFGTDKLSETIGLTKSEAITASNKEIEKQNSQIAASLASGEETYLQTYADYLNSWVTENGVLGSDGKVKDNLPKDIQEKYNQLMGTAQTLGLVMA